MVKRDVTQQIEWLRVVMVDSRSVRLVNGTPGVLCLWVRVSEWRKNIIIFQKRSNPWFIYYSLLSLFRYLASSTGPVSYTLTLPCPPPTPLPFSVGRGSFGPFLPDDTNFSRRGQWVSSTGPSGPVLLTRGGKGNKTTPSCPFVDGPLEFNFFVPCPPLQLPPTLCPNPTPPHVRFRYMGPSDPSTCPSQDRFQNYVGQSRVPWTRSGGGWDGPGVV